MKVEASTTQDGIYGFFGDNRWLSNFETVAVEFDDEPYPSVEHAYQAAKTVDPSERVQFQSIRLTPGQAKRAGRHVTLRPDWEEIKVDVMRILLEQKFAQEPYKSKLIATGEEFIEETNTWGDTYWGVCKGKGKNVLGNLIMDIRKTLK